LKIRHKVWFGRARAAAWLLVGAGAQVFGLADSVALVWWASVYANVESGFATAEGADDRKVLDELRAVRAELAEQRALLAALVDHQGQERGQGEAQGAEPAQVDPGDHDTERGQAEEDGGGDQEDDSDHAGYIPRRES
jgi:hypothetical protein